jgi:hypothetical protein
VKKEHRTFNIQHPTSNAQHPRCRAGALKYNRCMKHYFAIRQKHCGKSEFFGPFFRAFRGLNQFYKSMTIGTGGI